MPLQTTKKDTTIDMSQDPSAILKQLIKIRMATLSPYQKGVNKKLEEMGEIQTEEAIQQRVPPEHIESEAGLDHQDLLSTIIGKSTSTPSTTTGISEKELAAVQPASTPIGKFLESAGIGVETKGKLLDNLIKRQRLQSGGDTTDPTNMAAQIVAGNRALEEAGLEGYETEMTAEGKLKASKPGSYATATSQEDMNSTVEGIANGTTPPDLVKTVSRRDLTTVAGRLAKKGLDLKQLSLNYQAEQSFVKSLNSTQQLRLRQLIPSVQDGIRDLLELNKQFKRTGIKAFNKATLQYYINGGGTKEQQQYAQKFNSQMTVLADEMGSIFMGGNTPTERSLDLAVKLFNSDYNDTAIEASMEQVKRNLGYRASAIESVQPVGTKGVVGGGSVGGGKSKNIENIGRFQVEIE